MGEAVNPPWSAVGLWTYTSGVLGEVVARV